jgi:hypothetical protein
VPTETVIVITAVAAMFVVFSLTLAWAEHRTRRRRQPKR